jgi:hypothetical protein
MMQQLSTLSNAQSRSISPENFTGAKGKGGMAESGNGASCARARAVAAFCVTIYAVRTVEPAVIAEHPDAVVSPVREVTRVGIIYSQSVAPALVKALNGELVLGWKKALETSITNHVETFAEEVSALAELHSCAELADWARELSDQVDRSAVEEIQQTLETYPALCTRLSASVEETRS